MSRRRSRRSKSRTKSVPGLVRWLILGGLVGGVMLAGWYFRRSASGVGSGIEIKYSDGGSETIRQVLKVNSFEVLQQVARDVLERLPDKSVDERVSLFRILDATATRRMSLGKTDDQRDAGLHDHLVATQALALVAQKTIATREAVRRELVQLGQKYSGHQNPKVAREAYICLILAQGFAAEQSEANFDIQSVVSLIKQVATSFPEDPQVFKALEDLLERTSRFHSDQLAAMAQAIVASFGKSTRPEVAKWANLIHEKQMMVDLKIVELASAISGGYESKVPELVEAAHKLLEASPTEDAVASSVELAQLLESTGHHGGAAEILKRCEEVLETQSSNASFYVARELHHKATSRINLVGAPLDGMIHCLDGRTLGKAELQQFILVLFFADSDMALESAESLAKSLERLQSQGVRMAVISCGPTEADLLKHFSPQDSFVYLATELRHGPDNFKDKVITYFPTVMILNRGNLVDTGLSPERLGARLEELLFKK